MRHHGSPAPRRAAPSRKSGGCAESTDNRPCGPPPGRTHPGGVPRGGVRPALRVPGSVPLPIRQQNASPIALSNQEFRQWLNKRRKAPKISRAPRKGLTSSHRTLTGIHQGQIPPAYQPRPGRNSSLCREKGEHPIRDHPGGIEERQAAAAKSKLLNNPGMQFSSPNFKGQ
jgi:hypothetical protein